MKIVYPQDLYEEIDEELLAELFAPERTSEEICFEQKVQSRLRTYLRKKYAVKKGRKGTRRNKIQQAVGMKAKVAGNIRFQSAAHRSDRDEMHSVPNNSTATPRARTKGKVHTLA
jgi:hypothetical protein